MIELSNAAGFALTHLWQSVLISAALMGILIFGKRMSGATRYAVAGVALGAAVLAPMAAFLPEASIVRQAMSSLMSAVGADRIAAPQSAPIAGEVHPDGTITVAARLPARTESMPAPPAADTAWLITPAVPAVRVEPVAPVAPVAAAKRAFELPKITLPQIALPKLPDMTLPFLALWALGALVMLVRLGLDLVAAEKLAASARPIQLTGELKRRMGSTRVSVSAQAPGPMAAGMFRPQVILPESALEMLDAPEMAALMEHERAHIERRDVWAALSQRIVLAAFWWSPAMHWVSSRIDEERELACDEAAVARTGDARTFARTLTTHAQNHAWARAPRLAVGAMGPRSQLGRRIRHLIDMAKLGKVPANYSGRLAFAALSLALVTAIIVTPRIAAQTPPKATPSPAKPVAPPKPPAAPSAAADPDTLDGQPHREARIIVRGDGDLSPEQEAKIRAALEGIDANIIIDNRNRHGHGDLSPEAQARIDAAMSMFDGKFNFDFDGDSKFDSQWSDFGAQLGSLVSEEVLKNLPNVLEQVQQSLDAAGIKSEDDGHGHRVYKLTPEMKAEIDEAMAEAKAEMARAQVELRNKYGPQWKAKMKADMDRAMADSKRAREQGRLAWAQAGDASRFGLDAGIANIEAQLKSGGSAMSSEERRGLERALDGMRRARDRAAARTAVRVADRVATGRELIEAARECDDEAMAEQIKAKADLDHVYDGEGTALMIAAREGCDGVVAQLVKAGATVNLSAPRVGTALKVAADAGEDGIVRVLLSKGADPNIRTPETDSPLVAAVLACEEGIVKQLVERGHADVNMTYMLHGKQRSPMSAAQEVDCEESQSFLRSKGARAH